MIGKAYKPNGCRWGCCFAWSRRLNKPKRGIRNAELKQAFKDFQ